MAPSTHRNCPSPPSPPSTSAATPYWANTAMHPVAPNAHLGFIMAPHTPRANRVCVCVCEGAAGAGGGCSRMASSLLQLASGQGATPHRGPSNQAPLETKLKRQIAVSIGGVAVKVVVAGCVRGWLGACVGEELGAFQNLPPQHPPTHGAPQAPYTGKPHVHPMIEQEKGACKRGPGVHLRHPSALHHPCAATPWTTQAAGLFRPPTPSQPPLQLRGTPRGKGTAGPLTPRLATLDLLRCGCNICSHVWIVAHVARPCAAKPGNPHSDKVPCFCVDC